MAEPQTAEKGLLDRLTAVLQGRGYKVPPGATLEDLRSSFSEMVFAQALAEVLNLPYLDLSKDPPSLEANRFLTRAFLIEGVALAHHLEPSGDLVVVVADPLNHQILTSLRATVRMPIRTALAPASQVRQYAQEIAGRIGRQGTKEEEVKRAEKAQVEVQPVGAGGEDLEGTAYMVETYVDSAITQGATDIHFEWNKGSPRLRIRVDGRLVHVRNLDPDLMPSIINVIKIRSNLDTSSRHLPQDGRWEFVSRDGKVRSELRVSVIPTTDGEEAVLRILPRPGAAPRLGDLGFTPGILAKLKEVSSVANGMFLVTGPTGSGKTTTLFALIQEILDVRNPKILSVEDPVEYRLPGISQVQVNTDVGLTFATALRAFLRQDPDVILVGEIRDQESARIATEAAMTGHLVLGTLHTNSAAQAPIRLMEMGLEAFKVADSLRGVLAQRLVPRLCPHCRVEHPEAKEYVLRKGRYRPELVQVYTRGGGCEMCGYRGYKGRVAIHELLWVDDEIRRAILEESTSDQLVALARPRGFRTLFEDGLEKVIQGVISLEDLFFATEVDSMEPVSGVEIG